MPPRCTRAAPAPRTAGDSATWQRLYKCGRIGYKVAYTFLSRWVCMRADPDGGS